QGGTAGTQSRQGSAGSHPAQAINSPTKHHAAVAGAQTTTLGGAHAGHASIGASLTDVHAQRIVAVLNEVLSKVDIVMSLPPVVDRRAHNMLGGDLAGEIERYNDLKRQVNHASSHDSTTLDMQNSIRNVCRILLHDPDKRQQLSIYNAHDVNQSSMRRSILAMDADGGDDDAANPSARHVQAEMDVLKQLLASCKLLTVDKLTRSAQDEENKKLELQRVVEREKKIRDELKDIKQTAEDVARRLEMRTKSKEESDSVSYSERESTCKTKSSNCKRSSRANCAHREEELNLRKRRFKVESEVDAWISKYDQDMEEKQAELDDLSAIYAEEKAQLDDLQSKYDELNKEYQKIMDERRWHEVCAMKIQALWRGYKVRKEMREANDKKRKGSKSAKGKKKKK
ncbi:hypothetical protein BCR44DRAFT_1428087, partial [Catenaria anguillulae PL171]